MAAGSIMVTPLSMLQRVWDELVLVKATGPSLQTVKPNNSCSVLSSKYPQRPLGCASLMENRMGTQTRDTPSPSEEVLTGQQDHFQASLTSWSLQTGVQVG